MALGHTQRCALIDAFPLNSCDPNVWFDDKDLIVASRDIKEGEELYYDYALSESNDHIQLDCLCGSALCRGEAPSTVS
jgi:SET domain-containing protein